MLSRSSVTEVDAYHCLQWSWDGSECKQNSAIWAIGQ